MDLGDKGLWDCEAMLKAKIGFSKLNDDVLIFLYIGNGFHTDGVGPCGARSGFLFVACSACAFSTAGVAFHWTSYNRIGDLCIRISLGNI